MFPDADGSVAPALREFRAVASVCATLLLVTPLATVTVHSSCATMVAVAAARVNVAVLVPELAVADAVKVVVPHPVAVTSVMLPEVALREKCDANRKQFGGFP